MTAKQVQYAMNRFIKTYESFLLNCATSNDCEPFVGPGMGFRYFDYFIWESAWIIPIENEIVPRLLGKMLVNTLFINWMSHLEINTVAFCKQNRMPVNYTKIARAFWRKRVKPEFLEYMKSNGLGLEGRTVIKIK